jgi:hypothetical protein
MGKIYSCYNTLHLESHQIGTLLSVINIYADGVELTLVQSMVKLYEQIGLVVDGPDHHDGPDNDAETDPQGHHGSSIPRRQSVGKQAPYIPPPARGNRSTRNLVLAPCLFDVDIGRHNSPPQHHTPRVDMTKFDVENPKLWQI